MIQLVPAALADLPVMQTMASYYVYDMSEFLGDTPGWEFPDSGAYECEDLRPYFEDREAHPHFIRVSGELAGFAIVDTRGCDAEADFNMAQFFVHRKFKGRGVGASAATDCFQRYVGLWDVMVIPGNRGAHAFWKRTIGGFTQGAFEESRRRVLHLGDAEQDVFRFRTRSMSTG
jgi:ribosomal-protein-alanine N-acetyltransferase